MVDGREYAQRSINQFVGIHRWFCLVYGREDQGVARRHTVRGKSDNDGIGQRKRYVARCSENQQPWTVRFEISPRILPLSIVSANTEHFDMVTSHPCFSCRCSWLLTRSKARSRPALAAGALAAGCGARYLFCGSRLAVAPAQVRDTGGGAASPACYLLRKWASRGPPAHRSPGAAQHGACLIVGARAPHERRSRNRLWLLGRGDKRHRRGGVVPTLLQC